MYYRASDNLETSCFESAVFLRTLFKPLSTKLSKVVKNGKNRDFFRQKKMTISGSVDFDNLRIFFFLMSGCEIFDNFELKNEISARSKVSRNVGLMLI